MVWDASLGLVDWQIECLIATVAGSTHIVPSGIQQNGNGKSVILDSCYLRS